MKSQDRASIEKGEAGNVHPQRMPTRDRRNRSMDTMDTRSIHTMDSTGRLRLPDTLAKSCFSLQSLTSQRS